MSTVVPMSRATIMDVARRSGVSKTTVSVILNATAASARVPRETQERVRAAARDLGYQPSWRARALTSRRTHNIGVLYTPPLPIVVRGNYEGIMAGINEVLSEQGYHVLFVPLGEDPSKWGQVLLDQRMDGCLVLSRLRPPLGDLLTQSRLPVALINAETRRALPLVIADEFEGAFSSTRHLLDLGHQRIRFYLGQQPPHFSVDRRRDGYATAMQRAGLDEEVGVIDTSLERFVASLAGEGSRRRSIAGGGPDRRRPTGIIVYNHYLAVKLLQLLWDAGVQVPQDLSITAFTNAFPVEETIPPLTTVALPTEEMGRTAARLVLEQIESGGTAPPRRVILKESLIVRRSTAPPPDHAAAADSA